MLNDPRLLHVFVYGTLKRGYEHHRRLCGGFVEVIPARVRGRLYLLVDKGYPMLVVPPVSIVAHGTSDLPSDLIVFDEKQRTSAPAAHPHGGDWDAIEGEILVFDDPTTRLIQLDSLEEFWPDGSGEYTRVMVWTEPPEPRLAWTYVAPADWAPGRNHRLSNRF